MLTFKLTATDFGHRIDIICGDEILETFSTYTHDEPTARKDAERHLKVYKATHTNDLQSRQAARFFNRK